MIYSLLTNNNHRQIITYLKPFTNHAKNSRCDRCSTKQILHLWCQGTLPNCSFDCDPLDRGGGYSKVQLFVVVFDG